MKTSKQLVYVFTLILVTVYTKGEEHCGQVADVAFIIDSSRSIWIYDFNRMLKFVQQLVKSFDIGPAKTHIAALTFSHNVKHEFYFDQFQDTDTIVQKVGEIPHAQGDQTLTYDSITSMHRDLFSPEHGAREDVPHVCILLTDGNSADRDKTLTEAAKAKADGITIIGIGVGEIDEEELRSVVTAPADENLFLKSSFSELESSRFQSLVGYRACQVIETTTTTTTTTTVATTTTSATTTTAASESTTTTSTLAPTTTTKQKPEKMQKEEATKTCQGKEADIVFVIDMSSSIWVEFFKEQMKFVADLVDNFDIDSGKTQVGIVTFSDESHVQFYMNEHRDKKTMEDIIKNIQSEGGITNTHLALKRMIDEMFTRKHGSRPGVAHICILITDGRSSQPELTEKMAEEAHDSGIYIFAIGVGNMTDKAELELMATKPVEDFAFEVDGYRALPKIKNILAYKTCELPSGDQPRRGFRTMIVEQQHRKRGSLRPPVSERVSAPVNTSGGATGLPIKHTQDVQNEIQADILFGLHGIGGADRAHVAEFVKSVGGAFDLDTGRVRVGLLENCNSVDIELGQHAEKQSFVEGVTESMTSRITPFLHQLRMSFGRPSSGSKRNRIVILLVSGEIEDMNKVYSEIMRLKYSTRVIVVGIGKGVSTDQLTMLASYKDKFTPDNSHVFPVEDSAELIDIVKKIHVRMCHEQ